MSARISNRRDTIQKCINDLQEIGLIARLGFTRALKNNIPTPKYAFSSDGKIIALLLQRLDLAKKQDADGKIFQLFKSAYNFRNDSAANRLQVKLLERLKWDGLLEELLDMVTDYLSNLHELTRILDVLGIMIIKLS